MKFANTQRGITGVGIMLILILVAFIGLIGLKLLPVYLEHYQIKSILSSLKSERELATQPPQEVWRAMAKRMGVNDITAIGREDVVIQKIPSGISVTVDYEARRNLMGNVDLVASFHDEVAIP